MTGEQALLEISNNSPIVFQICNTVLAKLKNKSSQEQAGKTH